MARKLKPNNRLKPIKASMSDNNELEIRVNRERVQELGSFDKDFIDTTAMQLIYASCKHGDISAINGCMSAFTGIKPQDELEAMLAIQMVAVHNMSMEMTKRAMLPEQTIEGVNNNINRITKLMRTYTQQVEALQKYRTKGNQKITVQHVQVNDGGKAIVGDINQGGG